MAKEPRAKRERTGIVRLGPELADRVRVLANAAGLTISEWITQEFGAQILEAHSALLERQLAENNKMSAAKKKKP